MREGLWGDRGSLRQGTMVNDVTSTENAYDWTYRRVGQFAYTQGFALSLL